MPNEKLACGCMRTCCDLKSKKAKTSEYGGSTGRSSPKRLRWGSSKKKSKKDEIHPSLQQRLMMVPPSASPYFRDLNTVRPVTRRTTCVRDSAGPPCKCYTALQIPFAVKHGRSDTSILRVDSPKGSGVNIMPEAASLTPDDFAGNQRLDEYLYPRTRAIKPPNRSGGPLMGDAKQAGRKQTGDAKQAGRKQMGDAKRAGRKSKCHCKPLGGAMTDAQDGKRRRRRIVCYKCPGYKVKPGIHHHVKTCPRRNRVKYPPSAKSNKKDEKSNYCPEDMNDDLNPHDVTFRDDEDDDDDDDVSGVCVEDSTEIFNIPAGLKPGMLETHSLTITPCPRGKILDMQFGILGGTVSMNDAKYNIKSRGNQAITISVMAYCFAFHCHPKQWTVELIDNLVDSGDRWYLERLETLHDHSAVQGICEVLPFGKKHVLILNGKRMLVLLYEPDIVGYTKSKDPTVYNLCRGLKAFFKVNRAGIFLSRVLKVVIWRDRVCYFIFDPAGRDESGRADTKHGKASLINVKNLQGVVEVLLMRSTNEDVKYVLAALKVLRMVSENCLETFSSDQDLASEMVEYRIINENSAILNGSLHMGEDCFEEAKNKQAIPIAVTAMAYAKISPPNTWTSKTLDKILRLGSKLYKDCMGPNSMADLNINNIPMIINLGPYTCEIIIHRGRVKGPLLVKENCVTNIHTGLQEFFDKEYTCGIVQFSNYAVPVWKQRDMYFILDPYSCSADGLKSLNGKCCVQMHLNPESLTELFAKSWQFMPDTTPYEIHAFRVLKMKRVEFKADLKLTGEARKKKGKRGKKTCLCRGDSGGGATELANKNGEVASIVGTLLEEDLPQLALKYKYPEKIEEPDKIVDLDSPTISATQIIPPLPQPRDKTGEPPDPDPDPEPEEPPKEEPGEGGEEAAEEEEEQKEEEEPAEPGPPPPPSPEPELAPVEEEVLPEPPGDLKRTVLLPLDGREAQRLRRQKLKSEPLKELDPRITRSQELLKPSDFFPLPDGNGIIYAKSAIKKNNMVSELPFVSIVAVVMSYKYKINTWNEKIVDFVLQVGQALHQHKKKNFQYAPVHIIPKLSIGNQAYSINIDVKADGPTWKLEEILGNYFQKDDRCMITTSSYSCAVFHKNDIYYLFDGGLCNPYGLRSVSNDGKACFIRFMSLHALVHRILFNKHLKIENQQFVLSKVVVKHVLGGQLGRGDRRSNDGLISQKKSGTQYDTKDYDGYGSSEGSRSDEERSRSSSSSNRSGRSGSRGSLKSGSRGSLMSGSRSSSKKGISSTRKGKSVGYVKNAAGMKKIIGTTVLKNVRPTRGIKECHFVNTVVMLRLSMIPIHSWNPRLIDDSLEKGMDIFKKATNLNLVENRVINSLLIDGYVFNLNIKNITPPNAQKTAGDSLKDTLKSVMTKSKYVMLRFPSRSMVIHLQGNKFDLFDPYGKNKFLYPVPRNTKSDINECPHRVIAPAITYYASWTEFDSLDKLIEQIMSDVPKEELPNPMFYTYELTRVKKAPKKLAFNYKLSPMFSPRPNYKELPCKVKSAPPIDENIRWVSIRQIPWSRTSYFTDLGYERKTEKTMWKDWDIEYPCDLYSMFGNIDPNSNEFRPENRNKQYLAINAVALAVTMFYEISEWTSIVLDAIVIHGDKYYSESIAAMEIKNEKLTVEDLADVFSLYPYNIYPQYTKTVSGSFYNIHKDEMNLSRALGYFFKTNGKYSTGLLVSGDESIGFARVKNSYCMFDCKRRGPPLFSAGQCVAYMLKCESINRLLFCMIVTLGIKQHGVKFDLYNARYSVQDVSEL